MKAVRALGLAIGGGALWALCFATEITVWLPWVALVPLVAIARGKRPYLLGLVHGTVFWAASLAWIVGTLESYGNLSRSVAIACLGLLSIYLGLYHAVFAGVGGRIWRRWPAAVPWALPALWVTLEILRGALLTGFPWNLAAYAWIRVPGALESSAWIGAYGLSGLVVAANVAILLALDRRRSRAALSALAGTVAVLAAGALVAPGEGSSRSGREVRIVQPNTPILNAADQERLLAGYRRLLRLSDEACEEGALVVWPESAAWPFVLGRDPTLRRDLDRLRARGCSIIVNSVSRRGDRYYNSAFLLEPGAEPTRYDKRHLVPFGEYVPLRSIFPFLSRLARAAGDFSPGRGDGVLSWLNEKLGMAICFEIVFPGEVAASVRAGATALVTITNDAWYGDTAAPRQHFRAARFRAAENRRPLIRAALTGISAFVSERGVVEEVLEVGESGIIASTIGGAGSVTFYARFPWLVPVVCALLAAFAILRPGGGARQGAGDSPSR